MMPPPAPPLLEPPVRLALIGCGQIGRLHAQRLAADPRAQIVACADPNLAAARAVRDDLARDAAVFDDLDALVDRTTPAAAIVCTPTHLHFEQVQALRARGLPVLCEKPLADNRERIATLIANAAAGPLLALAYQRRYWATFRTLRREVASGRWGPVHAVTTHSAERWQQTIAGTWRNDPQFNPGGFIGDAGSHKIDMVFFVTGLGPREVFARSDRRSSQVEIVTTISGLLDGDVALSMSFIGCAQHWREDFHVHCAAADLLLRDGAVWVAQNNRLKKLEPLEPESDPDAAFLDSLTSAAPNTAPASCALPVWDFTQAVLASARTGRVVACPPSVDKS